MVDAEIDAKRKEASELPTADVKIILLGDSAVGKSKLVDRFLINDYKEKQLSTYALTMFRHATLIEGVQIKIDIWDTAGQECFNTLHPSYYFGAHACVLVFDVTRKITYQNLRNWYKEMRDHCPDIPCCLIANKIDVDINVTGQKFKFAEAHGLPFHFVSAADGTNVVKIFEDIIRRAYQYKTSPPESFAQEIEDFLNDDTWLP